MPRSSFARHLALWTLGGLAVRLAWVLLEPGNRIVADEGAWLSWARDVLPAPHVRFSPFEAPMIFHPPLYSYFLGLALHLLGSLDAVRVAQAVVGTALVPAVGLIGRRAVDARVGLVAAGLAAFYPELVWFTSHFWAETLFTTLLWWAFERYVALLDAEAERSARGSVGCALLSGALLGLAILTRETVLYLVPFLALPFAWRRGRRGLVMAGALVLATSAVVAPWTWRNYIVFGAFVPVSTSGGLNLFQGNARLTRQQVYDEYHAVRGRIAKYEFARRRGLEAILDRQPSWIFEKLRDEMPAFWEADSQALVHVRRGAYGEPRLAVAALATAVVVLPYLALLIFFVLGVGRLPRGPTACFLLGFLAYYTSIHVATHGYARYRVPALPVLFLVAAAGIAWLRGCPLPDLTPRRRLVGVLTALVLSLSVLPSLRFLVRADTLILENARFGLDRDGRPAEGGEP